MSLAPIVLFVYNRPYHTRKTIESLRENDLAKDSELFIYSDAIKKESDQDSVNKVREYIKTIEGFKKVTIIEREVNYGLANNIITGVTEIIKSYGKIIVLEDDLVTSKYFLKYMNDCLSFYRDFNEVWHVSGWNYPIESEDLEDVFFWRVMNCWGWGTWEDRWNKFEKNKDIMKSFSKREVLRFNLDGVENFYNQLELNYKEKIDTWAIYWYATIFKNNGLCLNPSVSYVLNIGLDGSGTHCNDDGNNLITKLSNKKEIHFPECVKENMVATNRIKSFYLSNKKNIFQRIVKKIKKMV